MDFSEYFFYRKPSNESLTALSVRCRWEGLLGMTWVELRLIFRRTKNYFGDATGLGGSAKIKLAISADSTRL